jgi:hypothetical protein
MTTAYIHNENFAQEKSNVLTNAAFKLKFIDGIRNSTFSKLTFAKNGETIRKSFSKIGFWFKI